MKRTIFIIILSLTCLLSAQEYTLDVLIQAGLENAYSIRQKEILKQNSGLGLRNAHWNLMPTADIDLSRTNRDGVYYSSGSLTIAKTITSNDPAYFNLQQSRSDFRLADLDLNQAKKEMVYQIYLNWLGIIQKQREMEIKQDNIKVLEGILTQSNLLRKLGKKTDYEVTQSEINLINARLSMEQSKNDLANQRQTLFANLRLKDEGFPISEDYIIELDTTAVFVKPEQMPISIRKLKEGIHQAKLDKLQQQISIFPILSINGRYTNASVNNDILKLSDYEDSYTLGINLSWSLWSPWTKGNNHAQVKNNLLLKQWQLEDSQINLDNDLDNLRRDWETLKLSYALNLKKFEQATENLRIAQERYSLGNMTQIELDQAQVQALDAELSLNQIRFDLMKKVQEYKLLCSYPILDKY